MVTGRVVGILERNTRDYVVSIPEDEVESRSSKVSFAQNLFCNPDKTSVFILWIFNTPVSYTHLTLPTICSV